jgi:hypothetical protein
MTRVLASTAKCPYCSAKLPKAPTREHPCPSCKKVFYIQRGQDGISYAITKSELDSHQKAIPEVKQLVNEEENVVKNTVPKRLGGLDIIKETGREKSGLPVIGEDIPWKTMFGGLCPVTQFIPFPRVINEQSQSLKVIGQVPYASLTIEILIDYEHPFTAGFMFLKKDSPHLPNAASMPIWNRVDFINLWEVFREIRATVRDLENKKAEVLVECGITEFDPDTPSLTIQFCFAGFLEKIVFPPPGTLYPRNTFPEPLFKWDERIKKEFQGDIFGNILASMTQKNHIYGDPTGYFHGFY